MRQRTSRRFVLPAFVLVMFAISGGVVRAESLFVFAASSTTDAVTDLAEHFEQQSGVDVVLSFAASSVLAKQIENGAPADIYIAANPAWMDYLAERGLIVDASRQDIASNRLALIAPAGSETVVDAADPQSLEAALGTEGHLAVGDPDHVPAGIYARQALESLGLWSALEPRLARTANVRGVLALVERGEVPLGIAYATDAAISDGVVIAALLPDTSHDAIRYPAARVVAGDSPQAEAFLDFMTSSTGGEILARHGFLPP